MQRSSEPAIWAFPIALLVQEGNAGGRRRFGSRTEVGVNIGEVCIRQCFAGVRRHIPDGMMDVAGKYRKRNLRRSDSRSARLRGSLPLIAVTLIASIPLKKLLAIAGISRRRGLQLWRWREGLQERVHVGEL